MRCALRVTGLKSPIFNPQPVSRNTQLEHYEHRRD
jgi:hypothetical protein